MRLLDLSLPGPAENLACDEALLDAVEAAPTHGILRFWEATGPFVVLGYGNKLAAEINESACREHEVPVLRRCSGGGCVLQGPGCLNYAVILPFAFDPALATISGANRFVMERHRALLAELTGQPVAIEGHTDLAIGLLKFSGNSQRRKRRALLFHGTFLLEFDIALIERFLKAPRRQPDYRAHRSHAGFLIRLSLAAGQLKQGLQQLWKAGPASIEVPGAAVAQLVAERYGTDAWNLKS